MDNHICMEDFDDFLEMQRDYYKEKYITKPITFSEEQIKSAAKFTICEALMKIGVFWQVYKLTNNDAVLEEALFDHAPSITRGVAEYIVNHDHVDRLYQSIVGIYNRDSLFLVRLGGGSYDRLAMPYYRRSIAKKLDKSINLYVPHPLDHVNTSNVQNYLIEHSDAIKDALYLTDVAKDYLSHDERKTVMSRISQYKSWVKEMFDEILTDPTWIWEFYPNEKCKDSKEEDLETAKTRIEEFMAEFITIAEKYEILTPEEETRRMAMETVITSEDGGFVITDPCYLSSGMPNENDIDYFEMINEIFMKRYNFINHDTLYGDWSCNMFNMKDKSEIGSFCADGAMVCVISLANIREFNPNFIDWAKNHPWCATIVEGFTGKAEFVIKHDDNYPNGEYLDIEFEGELNGEHVKLLGTQTGF